MQQKDIIGQVIGEWGPWQLRTVLIIFLCKIPAAWFMACLIFTAPEPSYDEYFCAPPESVPTENHTDFFKAAHPLKISGGELRSSVDVCHIFEDVAERWNLSISNPDGLVYSEFTSNETAELIPCNNFVHTGEVKSIITDFDLVCSRTILVGVTQTFHLLGVLIGGIIANQMLYSTSPRRVMLIGMITQIVCGNITGFVTTYEFHALFRCISAMCCALSFTAGAVIFSDITGGRYKTTVITLHETYWSIGVILLPGVAGLFKNWSFMYVAISLPTLIIVVLHRWIPDSPRWLLAHGRKDEAKMYIEEGVRINKRNHEIPPDFDVQLEAQGKMLKEQSQVPTPNWWTLFEGPRAIRHTICVHWCWAIYLFCYYGTLLNIRTFGREYLHVNTAVAGLCEVIGVLIGLYLILYTERKWFWAGVANILASLFTCLVWITPEDSVALKMLTAMSSKVTISLTLAVLTTCTNELVSADKKKLLVFSAVVWGRIWFLGAPLIAAFNVYGKYVPQTIYAVISLVGGLLSMMITSPRTCPKLKPEVAQSIEISTIYRKENSHF